MDDKLDRLYTDILQLYPCANESKREEFKQWFTNNSMLNFIMTFLDNNLKVEDTGKLLYLSRSAVIFRLGRIEKFTGCNIRTFKGAVQLLNLLTSNKLV